MAYRPFRAIAGLPRGAWLLAVATLVNRAGTMVLPFLAIYLTRELGLSGNRTSALFAVYGVAALVGNPIAGRLCDRLGAAHVIRGALLASGAVLLAFPFARTFPEVAVAVAAFALTSEGLRPASLTLAGAVVPAERRKDAFVLVRLAVNLGMSIGPAVGGFLSQVDFRWLFYVDGATSILAAVVLTVLPPRLVDAQAPAADREGASAEPKRTSALGDRRFLRFLVGVFFVGLVFFQLDGALPLYLVGSLGVPKPVFGVLFMINTGLILVAEVPINSATRGWSHRRALTTGALLVSIGFGGFALATGVASAAPCIALLTLGEMVLFPALSAYVADAAPPERTGDYMGTFSMAFAFAYAVGPALGVAALARFGLPFWLGVLALGLVAAGVFARAPAQRT